MEDLVVGFIVNNYLYIKQMLRSQRRIFTHRVLNGQIGPSKNIPQNTESTFDIQNSYPTHRPEVSKTAQVRKGLRELSFNSNINDSKESCLIQFLGSSKINASVSCKAKENLFIKIAQLIKNEEVPAPLGFVNQHKLFRRGKERPYTSLSHRSKNSNDQISLNRVSAVLHITKNDDEKLPEMTSTSRALMNYSKVYKNPSSDRFKVKKDKTLLNKFVHLDAQKVVFQQKQKKQPKQPRRASIDRAIIFRNRKRSESTRERYQVEQEEQFQLGGWDYTE